MAAQLSLNPGSRARSSLSMLACPSMCLPHRTAAWCTLVLRKEQFLLLLPPTASAAQLRPTLGSNSRPGQHTVSYSSYSCQHRPDTGILQHIPQLLYQILQLLRSSTAPLKPSFMTRTRLSCITDSQTLLTSCVLLMRCLLSKSMTWPAAC